MCTSEERMHPRKLVSECIVSKNALFHMIERVLDTRYSFFFAFWQENIEKIGWFTNFSQVSRFSVLGRGRLFWLRTTIYQWSLPRCLDYYSSYNILKKMKIHWKKVSLMILFSIFLVSHSRKYSQFLPQRIILIKRNLSPTTVTPIQWLRKVTKLTFITTVSR